MSFSIVIVESGQVRLSAEAEKILGEFGTVTKLDCSGNFSALMSCLKSGSAGDIRFIGISAELVGNLELNNFLKTQPVLNRCLWLCSEQAPFQDTFGKLASDSGALVASVLHVDDLRERELVGLVVEAYDLSRPMGVKSFLRPGSTIYSQSFISANSLGSTLDPLFGLAMGALDRARAARLWSGVNAIIAEAVAELPENTSTGARVDVQAGAEHDKICVSVRFPKELNLVTIASRFGMLNSGQLSSWPLLRESSTFCEVRLYQEVNQIEVSAVWLKTPLPQNPSHPVLARMIAQVPLDDPTKTAEYKFLGFNSMGGAKKKGLGFKKNFSERLKETKVEGEAADDSSTKVKGTTEKINEEKVVVKGSAEADVKATQVVKGAADAKADPKTVIKGDGATTPAAATPSKMPAFAPVPGSEISINDIRNVKDLDKRSALYESKIESLQSTVQQREQLTAKLYKEIEEIKDPLKRGVVGSIVDSQKEALQQNIQRLEAGMKQAEAREKELMAMVDKAIQQKDKYQKELKALETKLDGATSPNNSLVVKLQKQLDEANRQKTVMSKKISELTGKKAA